MRCVHSYFDINVKMVPDLLSRFFVGVYGSYTGFQDYQDAVKAVFCLVSENVKLDMIKQSM